MLIKNKVIVITGTLSVPRAAIVAAIKKAGGTVKGSVTNETDYLVVGDTGARGVTGKIRNAQTKFGATVLVVNERALKTALTRAANNKKTVAAKSRGNKKTNRSTGKKTNRSTGKKTTGRKKTSNKNW